VRALVLVLGLSVGACSIPEETFIPLACNVTTCGEGSTCVDIDNVASCVCDAGLQDNDGDGNCTATCGTMTCPSKMSCDDSSGTATCGCNAGFQDNDKDGTCTYSCDVTDCAGGTCTDASGTATCACAPGYQDKDGDNKCAPSCDNVDCGDNGCVDTSGEAICVCDLSCGANALCVVRNNVGACECQGNFVDFDGDGSCTATCGANLLNGTGTGGSATVASLGATGNYYTYSSISSSCTGSRDASAILCDNDPTKNDPLKYTDITTRAGARFYTQGGSGSGLVVIEAGSSLTFNTLGIFKHFRFYIPGDIRDHTGSFRFAIHSSTTTAPSPTDAGWVNLSSSFTTMPVAQKDGATVLRPGSWFGANQTSRFNRVEVQGGEVVPRSAFRAVKGFLCQ